MEPSKANEMEAAGGSDLSRRFADLLEDLYVRLRVSQEDAWSDLEVTLPQLRTMVLLSRGPLRMSDVAERLGSSVSAATSMVERLVVRELVERADDPGDRRVVLCRLTEHGRREVEQFLRIGRLRVEAITELLSETELRSVVDAIKVLSDAVRRGQPADDSAHGPSASALGPRGGS